MAEAVDEEGLDFCICVILLLGMMCLTTSRRGKAFSLLMGWLLST